MSADTDGRAPHYAYEGYTAAPEVAARLAQEETLSSFSANNFRHMDGTGTTRPYELAGPYLDKRMPDVWAVYRQATARKYGVLLEPGLVMRLGKYGMFNDWYVMFGGRYNQRFLLATSSGMACKTLADFLDVLGK